ncbi:NAD(P)H dehydrogenase [Skermanella stibiiresistens SB22]|uniref:NAD(P)H dehydrogenase n=1 Tax=Skermanella stibiiresistens SB22 TaxID=1385369 RepID=W9HB97_9PROT|nr:NAD(P)H-dependent oxidoreductase [Skermanella stibiiresistens]EWY41113.1 NAD(P)H dehydrogenase [Skermanella stibiiresistens SB22]
MRIHVIFAHPVDTSFNAAIHRTVVAALERAGHEVRDFDLHARGFDPTLGAREREDYHTTGVNEAPVREYVDALRWADALVFVFPTWWYGVPAILKGYLDRVWLPGVAFHLPEDGGRIQPGLTNIRKLAIITTHGSPWWFMKFWMRDPGKAVFTRGLRPLMARGCRVVHLAHASMDKSTPESRRRFLAKVDKTLSRF